MSLDFIFGQIWVLWKKSSFRIPGGIRLGSSTFEDESGLSGPLSLHNSERVLAASHNTRLLDQLPWVQSLGLA